jgi:peptidoglycan hydrolase-like protein with peptidoglycan-binding domain
MHQLIENHPRIAKAVVALLIAGAPLAASVSTTSAAARPADAPRAGGCAAYRANDQYPLRRCDKGPAIRVLQTALHVLDPDLAVDGYFGDLTERAVLDFQRTWGVPVVDGLVDDYTWVSLTWQHAVGSDADGNGIIDPWELGRLAPPPAPPTPPPAACSSYRPDYAYPIQLCGRGEGVRVAQLGLRWALGIDLVADSYFGPLTQAAVLAFQSLRGLPVTGEIDVFTWEALTGGSADGDDGNGSGIVDPWEIGLSAEGFPPPAGPMVEGGFTIWAVVLGASSWEQDPGLHPLLSAAAAAGYPGVSPNYCAGLEGGALADGLGLGIPAGSYYIVAVPFLGEEVARRAQRAFVAEGVQTTVALLLADCFR